MDYIYIVVRYVMDGDYSPDYDVDKVVMASFDLKTCEDKIKELPDYGGNNYYYKYKICRTEVV